VQWRQARGSAKSVTDIDAALPGQARQEKKKGLLSSGVDDRERPSRVGVEGLLLLFGQPVATGSLDISPATCNHQSSRDQPQPGTLAMSNEAQQPHTTTLPALGRYQLLDKLGQGGMGEVYLGHDTKLNRRVAVKVLPQASVNDAGAIARFRREAQALAQLCHPGIVQAYDSEEEAGHHFLVMEFVEGASLAAVLKDKGRVPPARAADYVYQAALAL